MNNKPPQQFRETDKKRVDIYIQIALLTAVWRQYTMQLQATVLQKTVNRCLLKTQ